LNKSLFIYFSIVSCVTYNHNNVNTLRSYKTLNYYSNRGMALVLYNLIW